MDEHDDLKIRERAYFLWEKEGSPDGREQEFWHRAELLHHAEAAPPVVTPHMARSASDKAVDEAMAQSFPASDPPSFTPSTGPASVP